MFDMVSLESKLILSIRQLKFYFLDLLPSSLNDLNETNEHIQSNNKYFVDVVPRKSRLDVRDLLHVIENLWILQSDSGFTQIGMEVVYLLLGFSIKSDNCS